MIQLGQKVRDSISGFEGIAVGRAEWLYGCVRICIASQELKDGKPLDELWLDEARTEIVSATNHQGQREVTGGPRPEATRSRDASR